MKQSRLHAQHVQLGATLEEITGWEMPAHYGDWRAEYQAVRQAVGVGWLADPLPDPARRGLIASADSDLPPNKVPLLKSKGAVAADWEFGALAWVAMRNDARSLILRAVSDIVNEQTGEAYDNIEIFHERARGIMKNLIDQLPDWLDSIKL